MTAAVDALGALSERLSCRLDSIRPTLWFTADIRYEANRTAGETAPPRHPHAVARSLLRREAQQITKEFRPLDVEDAEDALNAALSKPLRTDPRITISACARLTLDQRIESLARRQEQAEQEVAAGDHDESVRLDLLRIRLLDPRLGLMWWLDRHSEHLFTPDISEKRITKVLSSFNALRAALLRTQGGGPSPAEAALVHARVDELLAMLEDPRTAERAAGILEQLVQIIHGEARSSSDRA